MEEDKIPSKIKDDTERQSTLHRLLLSFMPQVKEKKKQTKKKQEKQNVVFKKKNPLNEWREITVSFSAHFPTPLFLLPPSPRKINKNKQTWKQTTKSLFLLLF